MSEHKHCFNQVYGACACGVSIDGLQQQLAEAQALNALKSDATDRERQKDWSQRHLLVLERELMRTKAALRVAVKALEEEAKFCEEQADTPSDEGLTPQQNQMFEDIHLGMAIRLRAALADPTIASLREET